MVVVVDVVVVVVVVVVVEVVVDVVIFFKAVVVVSEVSGELLPMVGGIIFCTTPDTLFKSKTKPEPIAYLSLHSLIILDMKL